MKKVDIITEESLLNRSPNNLRTKKEGATTYVGASVNPERYLKAIKRQQIWVKEHYFVYALPLNVNYEGDLIYYLDSLETLKPYVTELIRTEMANPFVVGEANKREYVQNNAKRRSFSFKFIKRNPNKPDRPNDQDVIDYLCSKKSKRAYLTELLYADMKNKGFKLPEEMQRYNDENKIEKSNIYKELYSVIYRFIEEKIEKGKREFDFFELSDYCRNELGQDLNQRTFSSYRNEMFSQTGVIKVIEGTTKFKIKKVAFKKLPKPNQKEA